MYEPPFILTYLFPHIYLRYHNIFCYKRCQTLHVSMFTMDKTQIIITSVNMYISIFLLKSITKSLHFFFFKKSFLPPVFSIICVVHTCFSSNLVRATLSRHFRTPLILPNPGPLPLQWDQQIKYGQKFKFPGKIFP